MWLNVVMLALGGAAGAVCRYGVSVGINRLHEHPLPWGTVVVNGVGSLMFGIAWAWFGGDLKHPVAVLLLGGFLGAFTTFSTFAFESQHLMQNHGPIWALGHLLAHNVLAIGLAAVGVGIGRALFGAAA
ncbi:MAG: CrcB family protein [Planctomycetota bacterium]